jgi:hypothetical protein
MSISNSLKSLETQEVWAEFKKAVARTAEGIARMAECWCELQDRGEDLSAYRNPMLSFLPDVASGKLLPEVLLRYGASPSLTSAISRLVPEDQAKLATAEARVSILQPDGTTRIARVTDLRQAELRQVLGDGRIRTPDEQRPHVTASPRPTAPRKPAARQPADEFDLTAVLSKAEISRITRMAQERDITPAELVARFLRSKGFFALRSGERSAA